MTRYVLLDGAVVADTEVAIDHRSMGFNYGVSVFEGIRAYWRPEREQLYVFRLREHVERLMRSARMLRMSPEPGGADLLKKISELLRVNEYREDVYVRPIVYKDVPDKLGVTLTAAPTKTVVFSFPQGAYLDRSRGVRACVSSWRRLSDNSIPARGKIGGAYVNSALAKTEAVERGFDEAVLLTESGSVAEGSTENIFLVKDGCLITPAPSEDILVGITRDTVIRIAKTHLGVPVEERPVDRSELYTCDEAFFCGTGAEITPIQAVDHVDLPDPATNSLTSQLRSRYFDITHGRSDGYAEWLHEVY